MLLLNLDDVLSKMGSMSQLKQNILYRPNKSKHPGTKNPNFTINASGHLWHFLSNTCFSGLG